MGIRAGAFAQPSVPWGEWSWLNSRTWDTRFVLASVVLVAVPLVFYHWLGVSVALVNALVAALVGGPHMYATYTVTFLERRFWLQHPLYTAGALLVPVGVTILAIVDLTTLLTVFLAWASFHVLQQAAFITDSYRRRGPAEPSPWARLVDYAVIFTSMYPFAAYKLVRDQFVIEDRTLQIPAFLKHDLLIYLAWLAFAVTLSLWIAKTVGEAREGRLNYTKTVFIGLTAGAAFLIPTFNQLDVSFQGMNAWHSCQYLAIIWLVNTQRKQRGLISNSAVRGISGSEHTLRFYLTLVGITVAAGGLVLVLNALTPLSLTQCYYIVVLGCLLIHYYFDTFLFTQAGRAAQTQLSGRTGVWELP
jgi:hypothetical protein